MLGLVTLFSCTKDDPKATLTLPPSAPVLKLNPGDVVLNVADANAMITYVWDQASYGAQVVRVYSLQMDKQGNDFKDAVTLGTANSVGTLDVLTSNLNSALLGMETDPAVPDPLAVEFRVMTTIQGATTDTAISNVVQQTITPYYVVVTYPLLQVPGNYQGWNPADSTTAIASLKSNGKYEGYVNFPDANTEFKFTQGPSWDVNWGDDGADGTLNPGGANILAADAGYYKLNVDLPALTYHILKTTWGLIGSATAGGWDSDTPMTYDAVNNVWKVTTDLTAAEIKFRANGNWDLNYGDTGANGSLEEGGDNIVVPTAGNYTIELNLKGPIYKYKLTKN